MTNRISQGMRIFSISRFHFQPCSPITPLIMQKETKSDSLWVRVRSWQKGLMGALLFGGMATATAAVVQNNFFVTGSGTSPGTPISSSDLLQTQLSSASRTGSPGFGDTYFYREDSGYTVDLSRLSDGTFGNSGGDPDSSVLPNNTTITFAFNLASNPFGYSLTSIRTYAGWDSGRDGQEYSVEYSTVSAPGTFVSLYSIAQFNPEVDDDVATMVQLTSNSGFLAENVALIRFNFNGFENGGTAYREFDIAGTGSVPEPSTYAMTSGLALIAFGLLSRHRKQ